MTAPGFGKASEILQSRSRLVVRAEIVHWIESLERAASQLASEVGSLLSQMPDAVALEKALAQVEMFAQRRLVKTAHREAGHLEPGARVRVRVSNEWQSIAATVNTIIAFASDLTALGQEVRAFVAGVSPSDRLACRLVAASGVSYAKICEITTLEGVRLWRTRLEATKRAFSAIGRGEHSDPDVHAFGLSASEWARLWLLERRAVPIEWLRPAPRRVRTQGTRNRAVTDMWNSVDAAMVKWVPYSANALREALQAAPVRDCHGYEFQGFGLETAVALSHVLAGLASGSVASSSSQLPAPVPDNAVERWYMHPVKSSWAVSVPPGDRLYFLSRTVVSPAHLWEQLIAPGTEAHYGVAPITNGPEQFRPDELSTFLANPVGPGTYKTLPGTRGKLEILWCDGSLGLGKLVYSATLKAVPPVEGQCVTVVPRGEKCDRYLVPAAAKRDQFAFCDIQFRRVSDGTASSAKWLLHRTRSARTTRSADLLVALASAGSSSGAAPIGEGACRVLRSSQRGLVLVEPDAWIPMAGDPAPFWYQSTDPAEIVAAVELVVGRVLAVGATLGIVHLKMFAFSQRLGVDGRTRVRARLLCAPLILSESTAPRRYDWEDEAVFSSIGWSGVAHGVRSTEKYAEAFAAAFALFALDILCPRFLRAQEGERRSWDDLIGQVNKMKLQRDESSRAKASELANILARGAWL